MTNLLFDIPATPSIAVKGDDAAFPIRRIFCVGRNYAEHAAEMGFEVDREAPFYFTKSKEAYLPSGSTVPYPLGTENLHHEMELVVALDKPVLRGSVEEAAEAVFAFGCGLDMTRRDLQLAYRAKQRPWSLGKDFENSAVLAPLTKAVDFGPLADQRIHLSVNGETRQDSTLDAMIWKVDEIISHLSNYYHLQPGDLIMTGTPAGVSAVVDGDVIEGHIDGLDPVLLSIEGTA